MFELLQTINETVTIIQQDIRDLKKDLGDFKIEVNQRFDKIDQQFNGVNQTLGYQETWLNKIESNMVQKSDFKSLVKILERKEVISKYETAHVMYPVNNHLNK